MDAYDIVLLEDDRPLCSMYSYVLRRAGYDVREAHTLQEAQTLLNEQVPQLFLCDLQVQNELALGLLKRYRAAFDAHGTHVFVLSSFEHMRSTCVDLNVDLFLSKPLPLSLLTSMVERFARLVKAS